MPWPALIGPALSVASSIFGKRRRGRAPAAPAPAPMVPSPVTTLVTRAVGAVARAGVPSFRRRRARRGLTLRELEKIAILASVVGRNNPAVTVAVMRAIGGRI